MADITVRTMAFDWPDDLPVLPIPSDISQSCELVALSFTLPYLEPYLIRTMSLAGKQDIDPALASDLRSFSKQEAQHHRNHSRINNVVRAKLPAKTAVALRRLEDDLASDYQRFTTTKSLRYNLAYAEGFEAMTLALALSMLTSPPEQTNEHWQSLMAWHLAEEVEHRTVTFDAYDQLYGGYVRRSFSAVLAQLHFLSYVVRMASVLESGMRGKPVRRISVVRDMVRRHWRIGTIRRYMHTLSPRYDPGSIDIPAEVTTLLALFDEQATRVSPQAETSLG